MQQIKSGSKGEVVELVQRMLNEKGYACGSADGIFGAKTESAVRSYQKAKGLSVDGIVGDNTYAKLLADSLLKNGSRGELVKQLQTRLNEQGYKAGTAVPAKYYGHCQKLMNLLEEIREACGDRPITINSGYRTESYNKKVDGAKQSQHLYAAAADIKVSGMSASEVYRLCDRLVGNRGGVGKYSAFTHVDVRGHKARW